MYKIMLDVFYFKLRVAFSKFELNDLQIPPKPAIVSHTCFFLFDFVVNLLTLLSINEAIPIFISSLGLQTT